MTLHDAVFYATMATLLYYSLRLAVPGVIKRRADDFEDILEIAYARCKAAGII